MMQDNRIHVYIYIYIQSINTIDHIRTKTNYMFRPCYRAIVLLTSCFHPKNYDVKGDPVPQIVTYTYYICLLTSSVQPEDDAVTRPKHVVVFVLM